MKILKELISTPQGKVSHTKFWSNVAYGTATGIVIYTAYKGTMSEWEFLIYLSVVGASTAASKFLSLRYGQENKKDEQSHE